MKTNAWVKRTVALFLTVVMAFGAVACGMQKTDLAFTNVKNQVFAPETDDNGYTREEMELIVDLMGDGENTENLTDDELKDIVDDIIDKNGEAALPSVDSEKNKEFYDEQGALTKPFDEVYPELIENESVKFSGDSLLLKMTKNNLTDGLKSAGIGALEEIVPMEGYSWYEAKLTEGTDAKTALKAVRELNEVLVAEYNYEIEVAALDDYKHFDKEQGEDFKKNGHNKDQWHFHHCGIVDGYNELQYPGGDSSVVVAVIDSGVDYNHEDLKDNIWVNTNEVPDNGIDDDNNGYIDDYYGVDIISRNGNGGDTNGHGTHVAGIIAARNNNVGVLGIAYNVKIMSVKAAMHNGTLNQADIAKAVIYAYENGAEVINMSFGGTACSIAVQDALATAYTRCVLVASAGNNGTHNEALPFPLPNYPAALTYVLGVMSVDETGRESLFTNWDVKAFSGVEYELYAPGENIMSTLPENKYGYLSGTSMAAPVVSAFAAILRSEFSDRDMYPTKFIYGQLASTSGIQADCLNPQLHGIHNLPQIADLNSALTKLPKPELNVQDYALFDDPKYSSKNNGDGVIDAGETIALGLTLRNRWGMSENTLVSIDTVSSSSGLSDPYITIHNPTVNHGSVGTYSTQDCGKIYTNELFTGWEDPFLITIADNCPNDYRFTLNVVIRCENALDEDDKTLYVFGDDYLDESTLVPSDPISVNEYVRNGFILPSVIDKDMVLTKDNLYIIPNATIIENGVTVRVEPGTHIQFWSDDADDPYADSYIAYLLVNGNFIVEGTKEEPVYIYPSQLMDRYGVEIGSSVNGYVSLKYADITNFFFTYLYTGDHTGTGNHIDSADHCTFRNNYGDYARFRYLSNGNVIESIYPISGNFNVGRIKAKDSVFYKLIGNIYGAFDRCIFAQCGVDYSHNYETQFKNCVFLGNSLVDQTEPDVYYNSSYKPYNFVPKNYPETTVFYRPETGTTYVAYYHGSYSVTSYEKMLSYVKNVYGGDWFVANDLDEYDWIYNKLPSLYVYCGIRKTENGLVWADGSPMQPEFEIGEIINNDPDYGWRFSEDAYKLIYADVRYGLYEIPGYILPEDITFTEYSVDMDVEASYQIAPQNTPIQLPTNAFIYESANESVLTVSENGLVNPKSNGVADVWVYSLDKAVRNKITFNVRDYVALEGLSLPNESIYLAVGENAICKAILTPVNTTRHNVTYISSDESVVKVENGILIGIGEGTATVTASCEGFTAQMTVNVFTKATKLLLGNMVITASLTDGKIPLPQLTFNEGADLILEWRSTDESVAVIENGFIVPKKEGTTSIVATDLLSGLNADCLLIVSSQKAPSVSDVQKYDKNHLVLLDNGELYHWATSYRNKPTLIATGVKQIYAVYSNDALLLYENGVLEKFYNLHVSDFSKTKLAEFDFGVKKIAGYGNGSNNSIYILTDDGTVYAWGNSNAYGQLGVGIVGAVNEPTLVNLDNVIDVKVEDHKACFLTSDGKLYAAGNLYYTTTDVPMLLANDAQKLMCVHGQHIDYLSFDKKWKSIIMYSSYANYSAQSVDISGLEYVAFSEGGYDGIGIRDGKVYTFGCDSNSLTEVPGITNACKVFTRDGTHYIATESGMLFGLGNNNVSYNDMAGTTVENKLTQPVLIPVKPLPAEALTEADNLSDGILNESSLKITFNKGIVSASPKLYANGNQVTLKALVKSCNILEISRANGFAEGVDYELVLEAGAVKAVGGITNTEEIRIAFTYTASSQAPNEPNESQPEEVIYKSIFDNSIERILTVERFVADISDYIEKTQHNPAFHGNAILNPISTDTNVSHWLRPIAPTVSAGQYLEIPFGGNWWGTTDEKAIGLQMVDYTDFVTYGRLMYAPYLTEAPENTFPFVTSVKLFNKYGEEVTTVGNETITFRVTFNRDMDTSIPLLVRFGSAYPYGDYEIEGKYVNARTWEGEYTLKTIIENGYQYFTISNGCSATDDLELQLDQYRFGFVIDTTAAQALIMQGTATDTGIELKWTQDDFDTLMGYNVYRSDREDGYYTRLNSTVISADTMEWFDTTVEPGKIYYYNFTVVQSDMSESEPSGKIVIMSKDTMAPNIYHTPVGNAFTNANLVISATVTDNLNIAYANLYYRAVGSDEWNVIRMNKLNDKYSAIIPAQYVTLDGIEYYFEAFDGVSFTYKGSEEAPYTVLVQEAVGADALGDVNGDGEITNLDALLLLYHINDKYNLTAEEFARADLNGDGDLWAAEALRILQYVSGAVGSVKM